VVVLDNLATGTRENLNLHHVSVPELIEGDIRDPAALDRAFSGVDLVIHMATHCVRLSIEDPRENHDVNATGTLLALMAAKRAKVKRFVYCSSSEVFGNPPHSGVAGLLREESSKFPTTLYGATKLAGENYTLAYHQTYGLPALVVRPFNAYGPRSHILGPFGEVIPRFAVMIRAGLEPVIYGSGDQTRDFTYVEDTSDAIIRAASLDSLLGDSINIARGEEVSVNTIAQLLFKLCNKTKKIKRVAERPGEIDRLGADISKSKSLLGMDLGTSLEEGLKRYLSYLDGLDLDYPKMAQQLVERNWEIKKS
jgi:UDP-glucose 4-epimerase